MTPREYALRYAQLGLRVVPIPPGGKYPVGIGKWQEVATSDLEAIARDGWWANGTAEHGIGVALGDVGQRCVFVVDVDWYKPGVLDAWQALCAENGGLPATWTSTTGGGGLHLWFWTYLRVTNANRLPDGVDTRGEGGQVVVPPSMHAEGTAYAWDEGHAPWECKLAKAPDWLLRFLGDEVAPDGHQSDDSEPHGPASPTSDEWDALTSSADSERPGDKFAGQDWATILEADGWTLGKVDRRTGERHWVRPGKDKRQGTSATTGYGDHDVLKVFTTSHPHLQAERTYSKLGYWAATRFAGDHSAAAADLAANGYGTPAVDLWDIAGQPDDAQDGLFAAAANEPAQATAERPEWPEPRPIPRGPEPPPWPRHVLPQWMQAQVDNVANQLQCPPDLPGMYALGALSCIGLGTVQVELRRGHVEHVPVWLVTAAPPSEGKSPAMQRMFAPLYRLEQRMMDEKRAEVAEADVRRNVAEKAAKRAEEAASKDDDPLAALERAATLREAAASVDAPPEGRLIVGDVTPEKLAIILMRNSERVTIVSDEAGALSFDRYGDKARGSNLDVYLQAWSGQRVSVDRVSAPPVLLQHALLSIVVGAQPEAWRRSLEDEEFRTRGLGARFMGVTPTSLAHLRRTDYLRDVWDTDVEEDYGRRLYDLGERWSHYGQPQLVTATDDAKRVFGAWGDAQQWRRDEGGPMEGDGAWFGKMYDTLWRLAGLIWLADGHHRSEPIDADTMRRVTALGDYWIAHRAVDSSDTSGPTRRLLRTLATLADEHGVVTKQRLKDGGSRGLRYGEEVYEHIEALQAYGWLKVAWPGMPMGRAGWWRISGWAVKLHPAAAEWRRGPLPPMPPVPPTSYGANTDHHSERHLGGKGGKGLYSDFGATTPPDSEPPEGGPAPLPPTPPDHYNQPQTVVQAETDDDTGKDLFGR